MKNYIGRKCKGFRFEDGIIGVDWNSRMEKCIGEIGVITDQYERSVLVKFDNGKYWSYPISLIEPHLIPETPEIPQLGEGVEMEVSDDCIKWHIKKVVAQMNTGSFMSYYGVFYQYARPIQEVKKYTKEELVKIVGHDFEIV
jgi:hypothetical protein